MAYNSYFPSKRTLRRLADATGPFPIKCRHMILAAERLAFSSRVIGLLELFDPDEIFRNREDFMRRCKDIRHQDATEIHTETMVPNRGNVSTSI